MAAANLTRLRGGKMPQVMAALRNLCITLIYRSRTTAVAAKRRFFSYHSAQALALLLPKPRSA